MLLFMVVFERVVFNWSSWLSMFGCVLVILMVSDVSNVAVRKSFILFDVMWVWVW